MKKVCLALLCLIFITNCFAQDSDCDLCAFASDHPHSFSIDSATIYIKDFQYVFDNSISYGGTVYGTLLEFKNLTTPATPAQAQDQNLVLNFAFCLDENYLGQYELSLAFTSSYCPPIPLSSQRFVRSLNNISKIYNDINLSRERFKQILIDHKQTVSIPNFKNQNIPANDVSKLEQSFASHYEYFGKMSCTPITDIYLGNFKFNESIGYIYSDSVSHGACRGIRYYFGYSDKYQNKIRVILCGVNAEGRNIPGTWRENSKPTFAFINNIKKKEYEK